MCGGVKVLTEEPTETAELSSWENIDFRPTVRESVWERPRPSACVRQLCCLFVRLLAVRSGPVPGA